MSLQTVPLSNVCEIIMGQAPVGSSYNENGEGLALIAGAGDFGQTTPEPKKYTTEASKISKIDDLILCIRATIGDLNWSDKEYCLGRGVAGLRPIAHMLDKNYLWHFIGANKNQLSAKGTGSTFKQVSRSHIAEWEIPLPPLAEQKRIAAILDKADAIRRKRQQVIQLADEFLRAVFLDRFGDPVTNPKGWEVKPLGSLIESGPTNGLYKPSTEYGSGIRILRIDGFYNGVLSPQEKLKRVNLGKKEIEKYQLKDRSIVINRVNSRDYLGKSAFVERLEEITVFESNMMNFSVNEEIINPCFLVHQLQTPYIKNQVLKLAKDAVNQSSINQQDVKSLEVIVPNLKLQTKFELVCKRYKDSLTTREESLFNCEAIFSSLGQRAFSGQL